MDEKKLEFLWFFPNTMLIESLTLSLTSQLLYTVWHFHISLITWFGQSKLISTRWPFLHQLRDQLHKLFSRETSHQCHLILFTLVQIKAYFLNHGAVLQVLASWARWLRIWRGRVKYTAVVVVLDQWILWLFRLWWRTLRQRRQRSRRRRTNASLGIVQR